MKVSTQTSQCKTTIESHRSFQIRKTAIFSLALVILMLLGSNAGFAQATVFSDDFSANQSASYTTTGAIGASAWSVLATGDFGARRNTSPAQLELTNDATATANANGYAFVSTPTTSFASPYNTTLASNPGMVTWIFNMRQIRADPAGLAAGSYGVAFVLAGTATTTQTVGTGYAIALGQSGAADAIRLIKYSAGLATSTNIITSNTAGLTDFGAEYLSIQVTYIPSSNTWELFLRNDGATAFTDASTGSLTSQGTAVDATYTGTALGLMGAFWSGSTASGQPAFFDNVYVKVLSPTPTTTSLSPSSVPAGSGAFTLTVNGTNFFNGVSTVRWNGSNRSTTYVNSTQLTASISGADVSAAGSVPVDVVNTGAVAASNAQTFTVNATGAPTQLVITSISPASPVAGRGFNVTVQAQDGSNVSQLVTNNTTFDLTTNGNAGTIGGTTSGTILAGTSSITVTGVTLSVAGTGATLTATVNAGDPLTAGTSSPFNVLAPADHLTFVGFPSSGQTNTNITQFTVEARRPDNSVDDTYPGSITISKASGPGTVSGTLTKSTVFGVATFNDIQFDIAGTYALNGNSVSITGSSSSINITQSPVTYNFGVATGTASPTGGTPVPNLTIGDITRGNLTNGGPTMLSTGTASSGYSGASGNFNAQIVTVDGALNTATSAYYEFILTPATNYNVTVSQINFASRRSASGATSWAIRSSADGFTTNVASGSVGAASTWFLYSPSMTPVTSQAGAPITFRIYGFGGIGAALDGYNWRIDDVSLTLSVNLAPPTVSTGSASGITNGGAQLNGTVNANGSSSTVDFAYGLNNTYGTTVTADQSPVTGSVNTAVLKSISGLSVNTLYHYRVQASSSAGSSNGPDSTFYTLANTPNAPDTISVTSSSVDISIGAGDGNPSSTQYAIQETNSGNYVQSDGSLAATPQWRTTAQWGTTTVTGLTTNTGYSFHVDARNGANVQTGFGTSTSIVTLAIVPGAPTVNGATSSSLDVTLNANGNLSSTQFAIHESTTDQYVQANGSLGASAVWQTVSQWGTKTVTGLAVSTSYTFEAKARNSSNVETAFGSSTSASTTSAAAPSATISGTLSEANLNGATVSITLANDFFSNFVSNPTSLTTSNFTLNNAPAGTTITSVTATSATTADVVLAYSGDFDASISTFSITIAAAELNSAANLTSNNLSITAYNEVITVGSVTGFGSQVVTTVSAEKSYNVSGSQLLGNIFITPPVGYEISTTSGFGFGSFIQLIPDINGTVASTTIYVRFAPAFIQPYPGNITHTSTNATIQNVAVSGTGVASSTSTVTAQGAYGYLSNIDYSLYQSASGLTPANSAGVMGLDINDLGGDALGTTLTNITFSISATTGSAIRTAALFDSANNNIAEVSVSNGATSIAFSGLNITAAELTSNTLQLRVTFKSVVTDNHQMQFTVSSLTANPSGSTFAGVGAASDVTGDINRIVINATQLVFTTQPPATAFVGVNVSPVPVVKAEDALGSVDADFNFSGFAFSNTGGLSTLNDPTIANASAGVLTFPSNFQFSTAGTTTLQVAATGVTTATSNSINVTYVTVPLVAWNTSTLVGGVNDFGPSPFTPTTVGSNVTATGLTRASGVSTIATAAARGWGGVSWAATSAAGISGNKFFTFTVKANVNNKLSLKSINPFDYRRSGTGATNLLIQYSLNGSTYTDITTLNLTSSASGGGQAGPVDLSAITALQDIGASKTVTFRFIPYGATSTSGTFYIYDFGNSTANDLSLNGFTYAIPSCGTVTAGTASAAASTFCGSGSTTISVTGNTSTDDYSGLSQQWYSSTDNINFTPVGSQNTTSLSTGTLTQTTYYYFVDSCTVSNNNSVSNTVTVTVNPSPSVTTSPIISACDAASVDLNTGITSDVTGLTVEFYADAALTSLITSTVSASGTYYVKVINAFNCSASASIGVQMRQSSTGDTTAVACNSFTWYGTTYTVSGTPTHTFTGGNAVGCDSVLTLHLTINNSSAGDTTAVVCNSFTWYGTTYTVSGTPTHTFIGGNVYGCDSTVTLHLTVNYSTSSTTYDTVCNNQLPFVWNGNDYTLSGTYSASFPGGNASGCDSVAYLVLTVSDTSTSNTNVTVCANTLPYVWNGNNYNATGNYFVSVPGGNEAGCDSIAQLSLTVVPAITADTIVGSRNACANIGIGDSATYSINAANASSYVWSVSNATTMKISPNNTGTSVKIKFLSTFTTGTVTVTINGACGGPVVRNSLISKAAPGAPAAITGGPTNVCTSIGGPAVTYVASPPTTNAGVVLSYRWTLPAGASLVSVNTPDSSSITIQYTALPSPLSLKVKAISGCGNSPDKTLVLTTTLPAAPATLLPNPNPTNACIYIGTSDSATFVVKKVANVTGYVWTLPAGVTLVSHPNGLGVNDTMIRVSFDNNFVTATAIQVQGSSPCGLGAIKSLVINRVNPSIPGPITGVNDACPYMGTGQTVTYTIRKTLNATSYSWTLPAGMVWDSAYGAPQTDTIIRVKFENTYNNSFLSVTGVNGCGNSSGSRAYTIQKKVPVTPGGIVGPTNVCPLMVMHTGDDTTGKTATYTIKRVALAISYTWTMPVGATIVGHPGGTGANDTIINVIFDSAFATGSIQVKANANCQSSGTRSLVLYRKVPLTPGIITASTTNACPLMGTGSTATYSIRKVLYATYYVWNVPAGASIVSHPGGEGTANDTIITVSYSNSFVSGSITVAAGSNCSLSSNKTLAITRLVPATPGAITAGTATACPSRQVVYTINPVTNATYYKWTVPAGASIIAGDSTTSITVAYPGTAVNDTVRVQAGNNCSLSGQRKLKVTLAPCGPAIARETPGAGNNTRPVLNAVEATDLTVTVMPNPSQNRFVMLVESKDARTPISLHIAETGGRMVEAKQNISSGQTITIGGSYKQGIYIAEFIQGDKRKVVKLIKL